MQTGSNSSAKPPGRPRARKKGEATLHLKPKPDPEPLPAATSSDSPPLAEMIATAAYFLAEHRQFEPGHEWEDWLTAERQIRALHS